MHCQLAGRGVARRARDARRATENSPQAEWRRPRQPGGHSRSTCPQTRNRLMSTAIVVGNPKPQSRTYRAAGLVMEKLTGREPDLAIDLVDLGAGLLDWRDATVAQAVAQVQDSELVVVASPTYKATYSGL